MLLLQEKGPGLLEGRKSEGRREDGCFNLGLRGEPAAAAAAAASAAAAAVGRREGWGDLEEEIEVLDGGGGGGLWPPSLGHMSVRGWRRTDGRKLYLVAAQKGVTTSKSGLEMKEVKRKPIEPRAV